MPNAWHTITGEAKNLTPEELGERQVEDETILIEVKKFELVALLRVLQADFVDLPSCISEYYEKSPNSLVLIRRAKTLYRTLIRYGK